MQGTVIVEKLRALKGHLRERYPRLHLYLFQRPNARRRFRNERLAERGVALSQSNHHSILFFTAHKCASVYVSKLLKRLSEDAGMVHLDFDTYFHMSNEAEYRLFSEPRFLRRAIHPRGYYYGALRWYREIPNMDQYAVLLVLRDPRDVMTSLYFSLRYSHRMSSARLVRWRQQSEGLTLDEFVLRHADGFDGRYRQYCDELLGQANVLFLSYEDMVADFSRWLDRLAAHLSLDTNSGLLATLEQEADFTVDQQRLTAHRRQVTPGEHRRKLRAETIQELNGRFGYSLERLGYA